MKAIWFKSSRKYIPGGNYQNGVDFIEKGIVLYRIVVVITVATRSPIPEAVLSALATSKHQRKGYLNPVSRLASYPPETKTLAMYYLRV
jgi:hypothetical protein